MTATLAIPDSDPMRQPSLTGPFVHYVPAAMLCTILSGAVPTERAELIAEDFPIVFIDATTVYETFVEVDQAEVDLTARDVTPQELGIWAQGMMGGDASDMLDI
jgi:hypothetical protein